MIDAAKARSITEAKKQESIVHDAILASAEAGETSRRFGKLSEGMVFKLLSKGYKVLPTPLGFIVHWGDNDRA